MPNKNDRRSIDFSQPNSQAMRSPSTNQVGYSPNTQSNDKLRSKDKNMG